MGDQVIIIRDRDPGLSRYLEQGNVAEFFQCYPRMSVTRQTLWLDSSIVATSLTLPLVGGCVMAIDVRCVYRYRNWVQ